MLLIFRPQGVIDDCCCAAETVDEFNNGPIFEILSKLTRTEFFKFVEKGRFVKVSLKKKKILQGELHEALRILGAELFVLHD